MTRLRVDGVEVRVPDGGTVLDAVRAAGVELPALCHDPRLSPQGSCRVCLVAVPPGRVVPACTTRAAEGAEVHTTDPAARDAARLALELIVSELPARALDRPAEHSELVRACAQLGVTASRFTGAVHRREPDYSHPYVKFEPDLCIACGRCVRICAEVQGTFALSLTGRGFDTVVAAGDGGPWVASPCVSCGGCVNTCPSGALTEPGLRDPRPITRTTLTTCGYCGVGCGLRVHLRDPGDPADPADPADPGHSSDPGGPAPGGRAEIAAVTPVLDAPVNRGHACVKGRFAYAFTRSRERLTTPLVRSAGRGSPLRPAAWDEAVAEVATRLAAIRAAHGPDAVAVISSARATNEENYLAQKFARAVLGTNNIDNCSRLCHAPSAAGLTASFGLAGGTNPLEDLDRADCILLVGANPTEAHPVVGARITQAVLRGAGLIVVDPRRTDLAGLADVHLRVRPGGNVALFNGMARVLLDEGYADRDFLDRRASGLDDLTALLAGFPITQAAALAGVAPETLVAAARRYGRARHPAIVYGLGVTEHAHGTDGVRTLVNLAILRGAVGTPGGCGVLTLRGQNNVQGASDMGALPDLLPGYQPVTDPAVRDRFAARWSVPVPPEPGLRILDMFGAALDGRLRALYVIGEDIARTDPDSNRVRHALSACDLVVCHDLFLSGTAEQADVVFPAASFLEKEGSFVNFDRRFQRVRPALTPPGAARTDFDILRAVAAALGTDLGCATPADALAECAALTPVLAGLSHERLDREGAVHWPCRSPDQPGEATLYLDSFATADGRAALAARPYLPPGEEPDASFPYVLITGRRLVHYNSGSMTRRTPNRELTPAEVLDINPADGDRLGVVDGDQVEVCSRRGSVIVPIRRTGTVAPGELFTTFAFADVNTNALTSDHADPTTGCPEYKVTAVALRPVRAV